MGWNEGYTIIEEQVISLYDLGILNKEILNALIKPFCNRDVDSGGSRDLKAKDGKSFENIVCFIMNLEKYNEAIKDFIPDPKEPDWNEALYDLYSEVTRKEWGFW